jgi:hypothetical protein
MRRVCVRACVRRYTRAELYASDHRPGMDSSQLHVSIIDVYFVSFVVRAMFSVECRSVDVALKRKVAGMVFLCTRVFFVLPLIWCLVAADVRRRIQGTSGIAFGFQLTVAY